MLYTSDISYHVLRIFAGFLSIFLLDGDLFRNQTVSGHHHIMVSKPVAQTKKRQSTWFINNAVTISTSGSTATCFVSVFFFLNQRSYIDDMIVINTTKPCTRQLLQKLDKSRSIFKQEQSVMSQFQQSYRSPSRAVDTKQL